MLFLRGPSREITVFTVVGLSGFRAGRYYNGLRSCFWHAQIGRSFWTTRRSLTHTFLEFEDGRKTDYDTHCTVGVVTSFPPKRKLVISPAQHNAALEHLLGTAPGVWP